MENQLNIFEDFDYLRIDDLTEKIKEGIRVRVENTVNINHLELYVKYFGWPVIALDDFNESSYANKETIYVTLGDVPLYCFITQKIIENKELWEFEPSDLIDIRNDLSIHYTKIINNQFKGLKYLQTYCDTKSYEGSDNVYDKYREFLRR